MPENTLTCWMNKVARRSNTLGYALKPMEVMKLGKKMVKIAECGRIPDIDVIIRFHSDPTYEAAVKNLENDQQYQQQLTNRANARRRLEWASA